jgi:DNA end-binding protein Ku
MPRAIWKAFIQFESVNVPVKLYPAVKDVRPRSHLLHDRDRHRLQQRMFCPEENAAVEPNETAKGYEISKNEFVMIDPAELNVLQPAPSREIRGVAFVEAATVDPRYLDRTYYLGPDGDDQAYVNLAESLRQTALAGMCRWVMRDRSYVGVLQYRDGMLSLTTHRYADEVVPQESLEIERIEPSKREMTVAENLVRELEEPFQPEQYHDEYEAKLRNLIEQKAQGREVRLPKPKPPAPTVERDLVGVLERSLETVKR